jgi:hypothetical protein
VATGRGASVDHDHVDRGIVDEGVDERHADGAGAHDQVVGLETRANVHRPAKVAATGCRPAALT